MISVIEDGRFWSVSDEVQMKESEERRGGNDFVPMVLCEEDKRITEWGMYESANFEWLQNDKVCKTEGRWSV